MSNLPDSAFEPKIENEKSNDAVVGEPWKPWGSGAPPAGVLPGELTPDGKLQKGQTIRKVIYTKCKLVRDTETDVLHLENGCIVYRVRKDCFYVSETWLKRQTPPSIKLSSTEDNPDQKQYLKSQSLVNVMWCPDGSVTTVPGEEFVFGEPPKLDQAPAPAIPPVVGPTVWLPPKEVIWGTGKATTVREPGQKVGDPPCEFSVTEETWDRLISPPPAQQKGCYVTAYYRRYWKISKKKLPNGPETTSEKDYTPETVTPKTFLIPGCEEKQQLKMLAPSFDEGMAIISGQEMWNPGPGVWVLGRNVRVKFEVAEDARRQGLDIKAELARFVKESLTNVIPSVADVLSSDPSHKNDREAHPQHPRWER